MTYQHPLAYLIGIEGLALRRALPWTLLGLAPEAARAAFNNPAVIICHFRLG